MIKLNQTTQNKLDELYNLAVIEVAIDDILFDDEDLNNLMTIFHIH